MTNAIFRKTITRSVSFICLTAVLILCSAGAPGWKIHNRHYKFDLDIPEGMYEIIDSASGSSSLYYDTIAGVILMISARESKFRSVDDYMNCSKQELEALLRINYGDSLLRLISCQRSEYYPDETTVLHFQVSVLPFGYDTYLMYFIHHRRRDVQISFTYKKSTEQASMKYIKAIMCTLKLRRAI